MTIDPVQHVCVVVAVHGDPPLLAQCLDAHEREIGDGDEILVVSDAHGAALAALTPNRPRMRVLTAPEGSTTPRLWALGLAACRSDIARVTIAPIVPEPGWRQALDRAFALQVQALGGAIVPAAQLRARDRAILFLRYNRYLPPWQAHRTSDVPGDHAAYSMRALGTCRDLWRDEFWENEVNRVLAGNGLHLQLDPAFLACYVGGESAAWFLRMRWSHGVRFGRDRAATAGGLQRAVRVLVFVLPGAVFFTKIARAVLSKRGYALRFIAALPWVLLFLLAWSLGEWVGWMLGARGAVERAAD